jgi:hypothetical protein
MIATILQKYFTRATLKLYHMRAHPLIFNVALYLTHLFQFLEAHNRLPIRPNTLFNDFLFQLKAGAELGSPLRTFISDKELAKIYIEKKIGAGKTPATLYVLRTPEEVEAYLPATYPVVIKPTHASGYIASVFSESDYDKAKPQIKHWLNKDYFLEDLERNYVKLEKKVIVEQYIDDTFAIEGSVHCMSGEPKIISLIDRKTKERQSFDTNKSPLGVSLGFPLKEFEPEGWGFSIDLLKSSRILSGEFSYIRIDFYTDGEQLVFGELTNLPAGGLGQFFPDGGEKKFSEVLFNSWQK